MTDEGEKDDRDRSHRANVTFIIALLVLGLVTVVDLVSLFLWQVIENTQNSGLDPPMPVFGATDGISSLGHARFSGVHPPSCAFRQCQQRKC